MTNRSNLIFILVISIILKGCNFKENVHDVIQIEREYRICFPKQHVWQNPAPTQLVAAGDIPNLLEGAYILVGNGCAKATDLQISAQPATFNWQAENLSVSIDGLTLQVKCELDPSIAVCASAKSAVELVLPAFSKYAHRTNSFPKQLVETPTNMSSAVLSTYWDLPETYDFTIQLDVIKNKASLTAAVQ